MGLAQSQNCDSISSGLSSFTTTTPAPQTRFLGASWIRERRDEVGLLLDLRLQHLQLEFDNIQELLEELHDVRLSCGLQRLTADIRRIVDLTRFQDGAESRKGFQAT